jgi:hypothetical protein
MSIPLHGTAIENRHETEGSFGQSGEASAWMRQKLVAVRQIRLGTLDK